MKTGKKNFSNYVNT